MIYNKNKTTYFFIKREKYEKSHVLGFYKR